MWFGGRPPGICCGAGLRDNNPANSKLMGVLSSLHPPGPAAITSSSVFSPGRVALTSTAILPGARGIWAKAKISDLQGSMRRSSANYWRLPPVSIQQKACPQCASGASRSSARKAPVEARRVGAKAAMPPRCTTCERFTLVGRQAATCFAVRAGSEPAQPRTCVRTAAKGRLGARSRHWTRRHSPHAQACPVPADEFATSLPSHCSSAGRMRAPG